MRGHISVAEAQPLPEPPPKPAPRPRIARSAPWTEKVYVSPSGRIFLPAGFDFEKGMPRTLTHRSVRRQPPVERPPLPRARVVIGQVVARPRTRTRESWVVPPHLAPA